MPHLTKQLTISEWRLYVLHRTRTWRWMCGWVLWRFEVQNGTLTTSLATHIWTPLLRLEQPELLCVRRQCDRQLAFWVLKDGWSGVEPDFTCNTFTFFPLFVKRAWMNLPQHSLSWTWTCFYVSCMWGGIFHFIARLSQVFTKSLLVDCGTGTHSWLLCLLAQYCFYFHSGCIALR